jgi:ABC-2 type transport system permease protein
MSPAGRAAAPATSASGFGAFVKKEFLETRRTWRLWVLPGIMVLVLGLGAPALTAVTPALLRATEQAQPGVVIKLPTPTSLESYVQFMGDLDQLALLAIIIAGAAIVASERRAGTIVLVLTKPLSRTGFIVAKAMSQLTLLVVATALGTVVCILVTTAIFDGRHIAAFVASVVLWLVLAAMFTLLMLLLSAAMKGQAPAAGVGIGVYVSLFVLTGFPVIREHSPAGILAASDALLKGRDVPLAWPVATTLALTGVFLYAAVRVFARREL